MKKIVVNLFLFFVSTISFAQITVIPDSNFEQALIDLGYDTAPIDGSVLTANISVIGYLNINSKGINDLTGIGDFSSLETLFADSNNLATVDLTQNSQLYSISFAYNQLTSIQLSTTSIYPISLNLHNNNLSDLNSSLIGVDLQDLNVAYNQLNGLDLSNNSNLQYLTAHVNPLTSLNINGLTNLTDLACDSTLLSSLDLSTNSNLTFASLAQNNYLTSLDFSNTVLTQLFCFGNDQLSCLDLSNVTYSITYLKADFNSSLSCIRVDDIPYANQNFTLIGDNTNFSLDCNNYCGATGFTSIPDSNFEQELINLNLDSGPLDGKVPTANIDTLTILDIRNKGINNIYGIEDFSSLYYLLIDQNNISDINLRENINLGYLSITSNNLTTIDISNNLNLQGLALDSNFLSSLDVTNNVNLKQLNIKFCGLNSLNISNNISLEQLYCDGNNISTLDISNNTFLQRVYANWNPLTDLNVNGLTNLLELGCRGSSFPALDLSTNTSLYYFNCDANPVLQMLDISNTNMQQINVDFCSDLRCINASNITTNIVQFWASNDSSLTCIEVDDISYAFNNFAPGPNTEFKLNCIECQTTNNCTFNSSFTYSDDNAGLFSFTNNSTGSYDFIEWNFGDGTVSNQQDPIHLYSNDGNYTVVLAIGDSNCIDYYTQTLNVSNTSNSNQCQSAFNFYTDPSFYGVLVVNNSIGSNLSYYWEFGDGNTSNLQYPSYNYTSLGPFNLCLTVNNGSGCIDTYCDSIGSNGIIVKTGGFAINVVEPVGLEENKLSILSIYPNPVNETLNINLGEVKKETRISINNALGQLVVSKKYLSTNSISLEINIPKGIYFLKIESEGEIVSRKIIKQ